MKLSHVSSLLVIAVFAVTLAPAQSQPQSQTPLPAPQHEWIPRGVDSLRQSSSSKTEITFDHSMLVLASKLDPDNEDLRRVIAGIDSISVHSYRYAKAWIYDLQSLDSINDEYHAAGWMRVMNNHDKNGSAGVTNLWVRLGNNAISNIAILVAKSNEVDYFVVSGSISPIDLAHLGGHFGIPKIEGGVTVPNTDHR